MKYEVLVIWSVRLVPVRAEQWSSCVWRNWFGGYMAMQEKLAEAKAELEGLGAKVMANTMNVTKEEEWKACIDEVVSSVALLLT